jgi:cell division protein FtsW
MGRGIAYILVISFLLLTALGFVMLLSTAPYSQEGQLDAFAGVRRQGLWLLLGLVAAGVLAATDYHRLNAAVGPIFWVSVTLLVLCLLPGVGVKVGGASRWIGLRIPGVGSFTGQPSELAKLSTVIALAAWCARFRDRRREFWGGFVLPLGMVAVPVALIAVEVDLGTASLIFLVCTAMLYIAGTRTIYILGLIVIGGGLLAGAIHLIPNRTARITAFLYLNEPTEPAAGGAGAALGGAAEPTVLDRLTGFLNLDLSDPKLRDEIKDMNLQQTQAMIALGSGGLTGQGLGESRQKMYYLPLPHTDSVFAIVGEEGGLVATLGVILLFLLGGLSGVAIALHAPDRFGKLLGFGLMALILGQAAINMGVTTGCLPNKGMPLPFISYGGSNLFSCLAALGVVLNIHRQAREAAAVPQALLQRPKLTPAV